jgi:hypothetical protein
MKTGLRIHNLAAAPLNTVTTLRRFDTNDLDPKIKRLVYQIRLRRKERFMLDFKAVNDKEKTIDELVAHLTHEELHDLTHEMIDKMQDLIAGCVDEDVTFEPSDPDAHDTYAIDPAEEDLAWNLGHLIVHVTASAEESAALASELARGVEYHGRSRYEVPWRHMTNINQCRARLEESRRMRLASLALWPDEPHLDITYKSYAGYVNAVGRFVLGLMHDDAHLAQIAEVVRQAKAARSGQS